MSMTRRSMRADWCLLYTSEIVVGLRLRLQSIRIKGGVPGLS